MITHGQTAVKRRQCIQLRNGHQWIEFSIAQIHNTHRYTATHKLLAQLQARNSQGLSGRVHNALGVSFRWARRTQRVKKI